MKICIDAGHNYSGYDTGVVGVGGIKEQDITFDIANKLKSLLLSVGNTIVMTRNLKEENLGTDVNSSLKKRADICNKNNCDLFISIHCNSGSAKANGTEVLIPGKGGKAEEYATKVADSICRGLDTTNRGVRVDTEYLGYKLYVLHNTDCPAILIEVGFLTNAEDADKLLNRTVAFAEAIASVFGVIEKGTPRFTDVSGHWAEKHIEKLVDYGIVNGFEDGTFRPDEPITRAQAAVMISNALSVLGK